MAYHRAVDMQVPIGCGEVAVFPGDIVVGDADGVTVIPRHLAADIAQAGKAQERREAFLLGLIDQGAPLWGTYPPDEATLARFADWEASHGDD
jgi:regulator of RNase E activity RraA